MLGETDEYLQAIFTAREAARVVRRDVDFGVRLNELAVGGRHLHLYATRAEYPDVFVAAARRAPGRQRRSRAAPPRRPSSTRSSPAWW